MARVHFIGVAFSRQLAIAALAGAAVLAPLAAPPAVAADNAPPSRPLVNPVTQPAFSFASVVPLDHESLGARLQQAGLKFEARPLNGKPAYLVNADVPDKMTIRIWVAFDADRRQVVYEAILGAPLDLASPAAKAVLQQCLESNASIGPAYFAMKPGDARLRLMRQIAGEEVTSAKLRETLTAFADTIEKSSTLWGHAGEEEKAPAPGWRRGRPGEVKPSGRPLSGQSGE